MVCGPCSKDDVIDVPVERKTIVIPSNKTHARYLRAYSTSNVPSAVFVTDNTVKPQPT